MALAPVIDKLDSVPEGVRGAYVEKDGKFHLDVEFEDVGGLKTALASERKLRADADKSVAAWKKLGKSPDEIDEMLAAERTKAEQAALKAGKFDEVLATHLGNAKKERDEAVGAATKKTDSALTLARKAIVDTRVGGALTKAKVTPEGLDLMTERFGRRVKLEFADDGSETISIMEADGKTPMVGTGPHGLATFDDLAKEAVKGYPSLFEGTGVGGSGMDSKGQRRDASGKTLTRAEFEALSATDRHAKMKAGFKLVD